MLKRNEGTIDRVLRVLVATVLLLAGLFWLGGLQGRALGLIVAVFSLLPLTTGVTGVCPMYIPFGISTLEKGKEHNHRCPAMANCCLPGLREPGEVPGTGTQIEWGTQVTDNFQQLKIRSL